MSALHLVSAPEIPDSDLPELAALFSQIGGVLAGFAFAALVSLVLALLTMDRPARESTAAVGPLSILLMSLLVGSVTLAMVAGEVHVGPRTLSLFPIASAQFTFGGFLIGHMLIVLIVGVERDLPYRLENLRAAAMPLRSGVALLCPAYIVAVYTRLRDQFDQPVNVAGQHLTPDLVFWVLCGGPVLFCLVVVIGNVVARDRLLAAIRPWPSRFVRTRTGEHDVVDKRFATILAYGYLVGTLVCAVIVAIARSMLDPAASIPLWAQLVLVSCLAWYCVPLVLSAMTYGRTTDYVVPADHDGTG